MAAPIVDLCKSVKDHIAAQTYSYKFNVHRVNFVPQSDLSDTRLTNVYVYPATPVGSATEVYTREKFFRRYQVTVHLTNYIDDPDMNREIDDALNLAHEVEQSLENVQMGAFHMMGFESATSGRPFFEVENAAQRNYFHVAITIDYEGVV